MTNLDQPMEIDDQIRLMKKYVIFTRKTRMRKMLEYTGYFRLSRYGKYLLSQTSVLKSKADQNMLFNMYAADTELRKLVFQYCKKAEVQFKSHLCNSISIKVHDSVFYLDKQYYTESKSERDSIKRKSNKKFFNDKFFKNLATQERGLRSNINKYPELKEYRNGGQRNKRKIPCWAFFSYVEFGTITNIYSYLSGDLRKEVLSYGYSGTNYGKETTKFVDTWLDAIRNLRNVCAHHNRLIGRTSSIVLLDKIDDQVLLKSDTDLFSRIYAIKKILRKEDGELFKKELSRLIKKSKFDFIFMGVIPVDWEEQYDKIHYL